MKVRLRMMQGSLQKRDGAAADEITVRKSHYYIGSDPACNLRCPTSGVSPRHCVLVQQDKQQLAVHDLNSQTGTYVNERKVVGRQDLKHGDLLRVGRMEFEVVFGEDSAIDPGHELFGDRWRGDPLEPKPVAPVDRLDGDITEMLVRADEHEREERIANPDAMRFDSSQVGSDEPPPTPAADGDEPSSKKPKRKKPGKLPAQPKPQIVAGDDSTQAADDMLKKMFGPRPE